ncbi:MAG: peptidoglycan-binding protein [Epsilonproteobacteria bacterium]|nr:peptidoglycan-binding protein [Campylobacterota bacterium]
MTIETKKSLPILLSAAVALSISGCAEKRSCNTVATPAVKIKDDKDKQIEALQVAIAEARAKQGKTITKEVIVPGANSLYPPNAKAGECYARVLIPAQYQMQTEKVLAKEAGENITVVPAKYNMVTKKILVKEASQRLVAIPATYKKVTEKVLVKEASEKLVKVPATYENITEKILVKAAHTAWKKGRGPVEKLDGSTGEILCLVSIPAQYRTVTKRVLKTPASTKSVPVPAVYKTVARTVVDQPASTKSVPVPAVYKTVKVRELVEPAAVKKSVIPETYQTVTKRVKVSDAELKWQPILCKTNMTLPNIKSVQRALKKAGMNPGPIDGIFGWRTRAALERYQRANKLSTGALTKETLKSLGVN